MIINNDTEHIKSRNYTKEILFKLGPEAQTKLPPHTYVIIKIILTLSNPGCLR